VAGLAGLLLAVSACTTVLPTRTPLPGAEPGSEPGGASLPAPAPAPAPGPVQPAAPGVPAPSTPVPPPAPAAAAPVNRAEVRAIALKVLPPDLPQRGLWADDIATSFAALSIPAQDYKVCALAAVIEQESGWKADPVVPGLSRIAQRELDKKREHYGIPKPAFDLALLKTSPDGRSYQARLDSLRTERELSDLFEDMIREIPLGTRIFEGQNPVRTGGATQVSVRYAQEVMQRQIYPWSPARSPREEVFTRRGGIYFGASMLLDYPVSYNRMLYRFADYNAGRYSSRNAAFQALLARLSGQAIVLDGDLLRYQGGAALSPRDAPSQAWQALLALHDLGLSAAQIERDLKLEKSFEFESSTTYNRVYAIAGLRGLNPDRAQLPQIELKSPKITRPLTSAWFAERCEARYRACLARANPAATAAPKLPVETWLPSAPAPVQP
jgi:hypothetical protein